MNDQQRAVLDFVHSNNKGAAAIFDGRTIAGCFRRGWLADMNGVTVVTVSGYLALVGYCIKNAKMFERQKAAWAKAGYEVGSLEFQIATWYKIAGDWKTIADNMMTGKGK